MRVYRSLAVLLAATLLTSVAAGAPAPVAAQEDAGGSSSAWTRLAGADRYETAAVTARAAFPAGAEVVYLARADVPVDAVAAGSLTDGPVLLVPADGPVPPATSAAIDELDPSTVVALGGTAAVSDAVLRSAAARDGDAGTNSRRTARVAGPDRFATAAAISRRAFPDGSDVAFVAAGVPDALAAGVLTDGPVLLVPPNASELPPVVREELDRLGVAFVQLLTGSARLDPAIFATDTDADPDADGSTATDGDGSADPHGAGDPDARVTVFEWFESDRVATASRIATLQFGVISVPKVYVASADRQVDALAAGSLTDGPIVLAPSCGELPELLVHRLEELDPAEVVGLGGENAVCDEVLDQVAAHTRAAFPEPPGYGSLDNATPAPAGHVEPYLGSLVRPVAWSRDGGRLLVEGQPPGRSATPTAGTHDSTPIGLYVHDTASSRLTPVEVPEGWSIGATDTATLAADGGEVFLQGVKDAGPDGAAEAWLVAVPVGDGDLREVARGTVRASAGSAVVLEHPRSDPETAPAVTVVDTTTGQSWDPGLDGHDLSELVPAPDASALVVNSSPRGIVELVRRDGSRDTVAEAPPSSRCRDERIFVRDVSDRASHVVLEHHAAPPGEAPADCPASTEIDVRLHELPTGRSMPLAAYEGDPTAVTVTFPALSADGSVVAFNAAPAATPVETDGGPSDEPAPDRVPFDGAPGPQDGERHVIYRVSTASLLAGEPTYQPVSVAAPWEQGLTPVVSAAGSRIAWTAQRDGRHPRDLPQEVVLYRTG